MRHLKTFFEAKKFREYKMEREERIVDTLNDILLEISDEGFRHYVRIGGNSIFSDPISINISRKDNRNFHLDDIKETLSRIISFMKSEGYNPFYERESQYQRSKSPFNLDKHILWHKKINGMNSNLSLVFEFQKI